MDPETVLPGHDQVEAFGRKHHTGLVTLLFTDLVASTALKQKLGDQKGTTLIQQHRQVIRETLRDIPEGEEIETAGERAGIGLATGDWAGGAEHEVGARGETRRGRLWGGVEGPP